ncbi:hypothetical protein BVY01_00830 [bacterium I07]|nr:hypothetical protein BVY01_00830 [bacterium I07]
MDWGKTVGPAILDEIQKEPLLHFLLHSRSFNKALLDIPQYVLPEEKSRRTGIETHLLTWGGMPALLNVDEKFRWDWLKSYNLTFLEQDLTDLARINDLKLSEVLGDEWIGGCIIYRGDRIQELAQNIWAIPS